MPAQIYTYNLDELNPVNLHRALQCARDTAKHRARVLAPLSAHCIAATLIAAASSEKQINREKVLEELAKARLPIGCARYCIVYL
jgi:hypothetical protein